MPLPALFQRLSYVATVYSGRVCRRAEFDITMGFYSFTVGAALGIVTIPMATHKIRGSHILAHSQLQSLMNYATETVFTLLYCPWAWIPSFIFVFIRGRRREYVQLWICTVYCIYDVCASLGVGGRVWCARGCNCMVEMMGSSTVFSFTFAILVVAYLQLNFFLFSNFSLIFLPFFHLGVVPPVINIMFVCTSSSRPLCRFIPPTKLLFRKAPNGGSLQCLCFCQRRQNLFKCCLNGDFRGKLNAEERKNWVTSEHLRAHSAETEAWQCAVWGCVCAWPHVFFF